MGSSFLMYGVTNEDCFLLRGLNCGLIAATFFVPEEVVGKLLESLCLACSCCLAANMLACDLIEIKDM